MDVIHNNLKYNFIFRTCQHEMSQYASFYVEPIYKKEKLEKMKETNEFGKMVHIPIKAAKVDQTCSIMHDDDIR